MDWESTVDYGKKNAPNSTPERIRENLRRSDAVARDRKTTVRRQTDMPKYPIGRLIKSQNSDKARREAKQNPCWIVQRFNSISFEGLLGKSYIIAFSRRERIIRLFALGRIGFRALPKAESIYQCSKSR